MGSRRTHEEAAVAAARAAYVAGFATTSNLEAGPHATACPPPAPPRTPSPCCTTASARRSRPRSPASGPATTLLVDTYDVAEAVRTRRRDRRARARRGPARLRRPGRARPARCGRSSTRWAPRTPGSSSPATSTSTPSPRSRPHRSTRTASAPPWSPAPAHRPPAWSTSSSPRASDADGVRWCRGQAEQGQDLASAGASGRCGAGRADGIAEAEVIGIGAVPHDDGDDRPLLRRAGPRRRGRRRASRCRTARDRHDGRLAELPDTRPPAVPRRARHPHDVRGDHHDRVRPGRPPTTRLGTPAAHARPRLR